MLVRNSRRVTGSRGRWLNCGACGWIGVSGFRDSVIQKWASSMAMSGCTPARAERISMAVSGSSFAK